VVGGVALTTSADEAADPPPARTSASITPVAVTSDAPRAANLPQLVTSADVVLRGEVIGTERGRLFGEPGAGAVESRLVTVRVDEVLAGSSPAETEIVIEEEGWLADGTPISVDGASPSAMGDDVIWFLQDVGTPELPVYVAVSAEGRYVVVDGGLVGATGDDPLVAELAALTPDGLTAAVVAVAGE
jgi:hypothetical protein